jgi:hypothetical protein
MMPGVIAIEHGAWYDPDENSVDRGGKRQCPNQGRDVSGSCVLHEYGFGSGSENNVIGSAVPMGRFGRPIEYQT